MQMGGPARVINLWGNYFVNKGYKIEVVSNIDVPLFYDFDKQITYSILGIGKFNQTNSTKTLYKIYKFLKPRKNEILVFNKALYIVYLFVLKKLSLIDKSLKLVYFAHGGSSDFKNMYHHLSQYMIDYVFDEVIALYDDYDATTFQPKNITAKLINSILPNYYKSIKTKISYIPNPLTFTSTTKSKCDDEVVLAVGRLDYIKGFDLLIKAWSDVTKSYPKWKLVIVGDGAEKENLQKLINKLFLQDYVQLVGEQRDVKSFYISSSIYVMSSRGEGMPMVVLEAMECGLPIVAFNNCGAKFLCEHNANALLCEIGDTQMLSTNIQSLIKNKTLRAKMGQSSKNKAKKFYIQNIAPKWDKILKVKNV